MRTYDAPILNLGMQLNNHVETHVCLRFSLVRCNLTKPTLIVIAPACARNRVLIKPTLIVIASRVRAKPCPDQIHIDRYRSRYTPRARETLTQWYFVNLRGV